MELQAGLAALERAGVSVFAISYDPASALTDFATRLGITYPLLSDEGGRSIRSLGLLNEQAPAHRLGIAHPGTFTLDEAGRVVEKHFEQGHRVRPAPAAMLERLVESAGVPASAPTSAGGADDTSAVVAEAERDGVRVTAWLGQATYRPWQQLRLHVSLTIASELHVYADSAPEGLCAFAASVSGIDMESAATVLPTPHVTHVEGIAEPCSVYEGCVEGIVPFHVTQLHPTLEVEVVVRFQACAATLCYPPATVRLMLPLTGLDLVRE